MQKNRLLLLAFSRTRREQSIPNVGMWHLSPWKGDGLSTHRLQDIELRITHASGS